MSAHQFREDQRLDLDAFDAGLLGDFGGGNVEWWQDYIRSLLGSAHDFYIEQAAPLIAEHRELAEALKHIASFIRMRPAGDKGSYQRGYDIGFNNAGLVAAGIAQAALSSEAPPLGCAGEAELSTLPGTNPKPTGREA